MTEDSKTTDPLDSPGLSAGSADSTWEGRKNHPVTHPSDAEKYRWIRSHRSNVCIVDALVRCDKDVDFDDRIAAEMAMCAAGMRAQ